MKKSIFIFLSIGALLCSCKSEVPRAIPQDKEIEAKIEKILSKMTLEEKVGQMTQLTSGIVIQSGTNHVSKAGEELIRKDRLYFEYYERCGRYSRGVQDIHQGIAGYLHR